MAADSPYTPEGVILNREHFAHTVGSGPWKKAVIADLRDGFGVEDIAARMSCRVDAVRKYVATLRRYGLLPGICTPPDTWKPIGAIARDLVKNAGGVK